MNIISQITALNELIKTYAPENFCQITFNNANEISRVGYECGTLRPYSKILALYSTQSFCEYAKDLTLSITERGLKPLNLILNDKFEFLCEEEKVISSIPEDVRLVLTLDADLIEVAQKIAQKRDLVCVIYLTRLPKKIFYERLPSRLCFILSDDLKISYSEIYSDIVSKIISLLDVKLLRFFNIYQKNDELTDKYAQILDCAIKSFPQKTQRSLEYKLSLDLLELWLGYNSRSLDLKQALCIVKMLESFLCEEKRESPNYLARAEAVSKLYGYDYYLTLQAIKKQLDIIQDNEEALPDIKKGLKVLAKGYASYAGEIISAYLALGGSFTRGNKDVLTDIKYLGDYGEISCISLLRENGVLEKII